MTMNWSGKGRALAVGVLAHHAVELFGTAFGKGGEAPRHVTRLPRGDHLDRLAVAPLGHPVGMHRLDRRPATCRGRVGRVEFRIGQEDAGASGGIAGAIPVSIVATFAGMPSFSRLKSMRR